MRTYGRATVNGVLTWYEVQTDANGFNDGVYVTALAECLLLNLGESPFFGTSGIPAQQAVAQQVFPDYYVALTQQAFSPYFASLIINKISSPTPTYAVTVVTHQGALINLSIPIPT